MSILAKYSLWLLGILMLAASCITGASLWYQRDALTHEAMLRGESIALNLASPAADAILSHDSLVLINLATSASRDNEGLIYAAVLDGKGMVLGHPDQTALMKPLAFKAVQEIQGRVSHASVSAGTSGGVPVWDISVPVLAAVSKKQLGSVHVGLAQSTVSASIRSSLLGLGAIALAIMIIGVGMTFASLKVLVAPLTELSRASAAVGQGDLEVRITVTSQDEIGRLSSNFNSMIGGLKNAAAAKMQQGRIEGELELARSIQADLLPSEPPRVGGMEIAFTCLPAKELGGDFYDCIKVKDGAFWGFLIADVSGKGVPAALHMANLRNLFRVLAPDEESPLVTLRKVNAVAHADMKGEAFVTLIYAVVNPKTRQVRMVNAGHDPAYLIRSSGIESFNRTAPPVGLAPAEDYDSISEEISFILDKGDLLFTYTDGVTEAMNMAGEEFSLNRVKASAMSGAGGAGMTMRRVLKAVQDHAGGAEQSDDITMLALKVD